MKKEFALNTIVFLLLSIIFIQAVMAQIPASAPTTNTTSVGDIKSKTDSLVEKEITIPNNLQVLARIIFGVKNPIEFSLLIILLIIWLMAFKLIGEGLKSLIPSFEKGIMPWLVALAVMLLIAFAGGFQDTAVFILGIGNIFKIFKDWSTGALIFGVLIVIIIALFLSKLEKWAKKKS